MRERAFCSPCSSPHHISCSIRQTSYGRGFHGTKFLWPKRQESCGFCVTWSRSGSHFRSCRSFRRFHVCAALEQTLKEYTCAGPLLEPCEISLDEVMHTWDQWEELADVICQDLGFQKDKLDPAAKMRIFQYYLPVFFWCWDQVKRHKKAGNKRPLVIGIQAVQGCGKTTLVEELTNLFAHVNLRAADISIDDFYLTFQEQQALSKANPDNFLLGVRGNALTHDLDLGSKTLQSLLQLGEGASGKVKLPRYNKAANEGKGDRAPESDWPEVKAPLDIVLFEGWMLGFSPIIEEHAAQIDKDLVPINKKLGEYEGKWDQFVDAWLVIKVENPNFVFRWRQQAERAMKAAGKGGMSDEQVQDFVNRYMPAYKAYLPKMYDEGPSSGKADTVLTFEIDESRALSNCKIPLSQRPENAKS